MGIVFAVLLGLVLLFAGLAVAIGVLTSQCISAIQGTEVGDRLKQAVVTMKPSTFVPSMGGDSNPMDSRVWFALRQARDLPEPVQRKARLIDLLYEAEKLFFAGTLVVALVAFVVSR